MKPLQHPLSAKALAEPMKSRSSAEFGERSSECDDIGDPRCAYRWALSHRAPHWLPALRTPRSGLLRDAVFQTLAEHEARLGVQRRHGGGDEGGHRQAEPHGEGDRALAEAPV